MYVDPKANLSKGRDAKPETLGYPGQGSSAARSG